MVFHSVFFRSLPQHLNGLRHHSRNRDPHQTRGFDDGDRLVADKRDHRVIPHKVRSDDGVQSAGDQHDQQRFALADQTFPPGQTFQCAGLGLGAGVEDPGHDQPGDLVDRHKDHQRLQRGISAAEVSGYCPEDKADEGAEFVFHVHFPFTCPSPAFRMIAG